METKQFEKITSRRTLLAVMMAGFAVVLFFTLTPWNVIPTQVTEEVMFLCESQLLSPIHDKWLGFPCARSDWRRRLSFLRTHSTIKEETNKEICQHDTFIEIL